MLHEALLSVDTKVLEDIKDVLVNAMHRRWPVYVIGNGGSAAIAEHWSCDHTKGVNEDTARLANVTNLAGNMAIMTAIANDISYDEVFSKQIKWSSADRAIVLAVSSSGNSPNIVKGLQQAKEEEFETIAFVGFDGGAVVKEIGRAHV